MDGEFRKEGMPVKPSEAEEEYFVRQEAAKLRKLNAEHFAAMKQADREREQKLHFMKCPKCGMDLEEIAFGGVQIDKCFHCEGIWLDNGELEALQKKDEGFLARLVSTFRP